jgi:hypothetical protein
MDWSGLMHAEHVNSTRLFDGHVYIFLPKGIDQNFLLNLSLSVCVVHNLDSSVDY